MDRGAATWAPHHGTTDNGDATWAPQHGTTVHGAATWAPQHAPTVEGAGTAAQCPTWSDRLLKSPGWGYMATPKWDQEGEGAS